MISQIGVGVHERYVAVESSRVYFALDLSLNYLSIPDIYAKWINISLLLIRYDQSSALPAYLPTYHMNYTSGFVGFLLKPRQLFMVCATSPEGT